MLLYKPGLWSIGHLTDEEADDKWLWPWGTTGWSHSRPVVEAASRQQRDKAEIPIREPHRYKVPADLLVCSPNILRLSSWINLRLFEYSQCIAMETDLMPTGKNNG